MSLFLKWKKMKNACFWLTHSISAAPPGEPWPGWGYEILSVNRYHSQMKATKLYVLQNIFEKSWGIFNDTEKYSQHNATWKKKTQVHYQSV